MRLAFLGLLALSLSALSLGCDPKPECQQDDVSYTTCIVPLLTSNCSGGGCHGGDKPEKNLNLETVDQMYDAMVNKVISAGGKTLTLVKPNDPDNSYLLTKMLAQDSYADGARMPVGFRPYLSESQLAMFRKWIAKGAPNDDPNYKPDVKAEKPEIPAGTKDISWKNTVAPLLQKKCGIAGCHSGSTPSANLDLSANFYGNLVGKKSLNGAYEYVKAGEPLESLLLVKLLSKRPRNAGTLMPPQGFDPLTTQEVAQIYVWIEEGAKQD